MSDVHLVAIVGGTATLLAMVELLRRRQLREKYAVLWLAVGVGVAVLGIFPSLLDWTAKRLGIFDPPNLLLFVAALVLLIVEVHLSWEVSRLEDETRSLAEELGLLRMRLDSVEDGTKRLTDGT
jgi:hypothetical protein